MWLMDNIGGRIVTFCILVFLLSACDKSIPLYGTGRKYSTDCGNIEVSCSKFGGTLFVTSFLDGSFLVQPNSLKIELSSRSIRNLTFSIDNEPIKNNDSFMVNNNSVTVGISVFSETPVNLDTVIMYILPCNYIMCNDNPLITDTIRIRLRN